MNRAGRDPADRLLAFAQRLMPPSRAEWGLAMAAELAQIEGETDRARFAVGCLRVALWQGPLWKIIGSLTAQATAVAIAVASGLTGSFVGEVIGLVLALPPALWWLGRDTGRFGQAGAPRVARIVRLVGYATVAVCLVVTVGFMTVNIPQGGSVAAATVWLGIVTLLLTCYLFTVLAATAARAALPARMVAASAAIGAIAVPIWLTLLPFNESLHPTGYWALLYPAALALPVIGAPAVASVRAVRSGGDSYQGVQAGGYTGATTALLATIIGGAGLWLRPDLVDSAIINRDPTVLPPDMINLAGSYLLLLLGLPMIGAASGAIAGRLTSKLHTAKPVAARWLTARRLMSVTTLLAISALSYPFIAALNQSHVPQFGGVGATSITLTPNGHALLTGADGGMTTSLWDLRDANHPVRTLSVNRSALFAPNGHIMASENQLWNVTDPGRPTRLAGFDGGDPVAYSPDGRELSASVHNSARATLWNVADPSHPVKLSTVDSADQGAFTPNGLVYAGSGFTTPATTTLWSITGVRLTTVAGGAPVFSPDGHLLATRADDGAVPLWNVTDPVHPKRITILASGQETSLTGPAVFSSDGRLMAIANPDGTTRLWRTDHLGTFATLTPVQGAGNWQIGASDTLTTLAFSADSTAFGVEMGDDVVMMWNVTDPRYPVRTAVRRRATSGAGVVAFTPDLTSVVGTAPDGSNTVALWHLH